jgi:hypothetical protein
MLFGNEILVESNGGLSAIGNKNLERDHPDYEYRIVCVSMSSMLVSAITHCHVSEENIRLSTNKIGSGNYSYYKSFFKETISLSRIIKAEIDPSSISDHLYLLSKGSDGFHAHQPSNIRVFLKEIDDSENQDIYGGHFYFDDKNINKEYSIKKGDDSLEISIPINKTSFSSIFESIRSGDKTINLSIYFPAYADWLDSISGLSDATTYIIDPTDDSRNFVMISSMSSLFSLNNESQENVSDSTETQENHIETDIVEKISNTQLDELVIIAGENRKIAKSISTAISIITLCIIAMAIKVIF